MTTGIKTAATEYQKQTTFAQDLLKRISTRLSEHQAQHANRPSDWGFVGDLSRVNEELAEVLASLGDRSGVDELGIKY